MAVGLLDTEDERVERVLTDAQVEAVEVPEAHLVGGIVLEVVPDAFNTVGVDDRHEVGVEVFNAAILTTGEEDPDGELEIDSIGETVPVGVNVPSEVGKSEPDTTEVNEL